MHGLLKPESQRAHHPIGCGKHQTSLAVTFLLNGFFADLTQFEVMRRGPMKIHEE